MEKEEKRTHKRSVLVAIDPINGMFIAATNLGSSVLTTAQSYLLCMTCLMR